MISSICGAGKTKEATCKRISALSNTIHRNKLKYQEDLNVRLTL